MLTATPAISQEDVMISDYMAEDQSLDDPMYQDPMTQESMMDMESVTNSNSASSIDTMDPLISEMPQPDPTTDIEISTIDMEAEEIFKTITDLERQSILLKLQTEKMKLIKDQEKLNMELSKIRLEQKKLERSLEMAEKGIPMEQIEEELVASSSSSSSSSNSSSSSKKEKKDEFKVTEKYSVTNVKGTGGEFIVTIKEKDTQRNIQIKPGTTLENGYKISRITQNEGIVFEKGGDTQRLSFNN
jgi:hypothetical protein